MKRKKGFTLIELLAVIVILAIIAIIAVPIVLNIIDESKKNSTLRSAEMYAKAAELSIAQATLKNKNITDKTYSIMEDGNICLETLIDGKCIGTGNRENHEEDIIKVEVNGEVPKEGTVTITNGNITGLKIEIEGKEIYKNSKGDVAYVKLLDEVCEPAEEQLYSSTPKTAGYKYKCKVDPNKDPYMFYVLTTPSSTDTSINLIMDQNINSDGTPAGTNGVDEYSEIYNLVSWISNDEYYKDVGGVIPDEAFEYIGCSGAYYCGYNDKGPITAMSFLKESTKNWTNTNEMVINTYFDETGKSYNMQSFNTYARLPIYLSDATKTELSSKTELNAYLYINLAEEFSPYGYWSLTAASNEPHSAWRTVLYDGVGSVDSDDWGTRGVSFADFTGVRPVVNLKI